MLDRDASGRWTKTRLGSGNQDARPSKGASEVKVGRLRGGATYVATIEPWHGYQVVVYTKDRGNALVVGRDCSLVAARDRRAVAVGACRLDAPISTATTTMS